MIKRFFDFEVLPHYWLCVFGDLVDENSELTEESKDNFMYVDSTMPDARGKLISYLKEDNRVLFGFNIKHYDLMIANAIYQGFSPEQVKIINDMIINPGCKFESKEHIRLQPFINKRMSGLTYEDLMDDAGEGSLKQREAILGLNILESYVDFNKEDLTQEDIKDLLYYCKQDVYASMQFYKMVVAPYCATKLAIGNAFNIDEKTCYMSTNAQMVALALRAIRTTFSDTDKIEIDLPDKIKNYCYENVPSNILHHLMNSQESLTTNIFNNEVSYGNGGIHSTYAKCLYVESDPEWMLMNIDAESYYPSEMIQFKTISRAVQNSDDLKLIFAERMRIKHLANPTPEETNKQKAYKLVMNTLFGASGDKYNSLYDPYMCSKTCRVGQIFLTALACKLTKNVNGFKVIQGNTDGLLCYFRRKDFDFVKKYTQEWTNLSGINLEYEEVERIWQRDVNNYLMIEKGGKLKNKGGWLNNTIYRKGTVRLSPLTGFVSANAAIEFLTKGKDIIQTILKCKNIDQFAIVCTKGPTYRGVIQRYADGHEEKLFKCNRVIASKNTALGKLYKYKVIMGETRYTQMSNVPEYCKTLNNDLYKYNFNDLQPEIDYMYYIMKAADMLDIQWTKLSGDTVHKTSDFDCPYCQD